MRRVLILLVASATMLLVSAGSAWAQQYPPAPAEAGAGAGGEGLAITGSDTLPLLWIGLALLVAGAVLVMATRRRAAVRARSVTKAVA
jgi:LPXTG-motif cell wall-anchored protein